MARLLHRRSEIDERREVLLREPGVDRKQIERECLDAKAKERANIQAGIEWDNATGIRQSLIRWLLVVPRSRGDVYLSPFRRPSRLLGRPCTHCLLYTSYA